MVKNEGEQGGNFPGNLMYANTINLKRQEITKKYILLRQSLRDFMFACVTFRTPCKENSPVCNDVTTFILRAGGNALHSLTFFFAEEDSTQSYDLKQAKVINLTYSFSLFWTIVNSLNLDTSGGGGEPTSRFYHC